MQDRDGSARAIHSPGVRSQRMSITRQDREKLNGQRGKVIWFTGLSGAGKSTLANALEVALHKRGHHTYLLDGDTLRQGLNGDLRFSEADRNENIRRTTEVAKLMMDAGLIVIAALISPFRQGRETARAVIGSEDFVEVYVSTSLDVCERRDPKGLYKKARSGDLPDFTGIGSPYEAPESPDIELDAGALPVDESVARLLDLLNVVQPSRTNMR